MGHKRRIYINKFNRLSQTWSTIPLRNLLPILQFGSRTRLGIPKHEWGEGQNHWPWSWREIPFMLGQNDNYEFDYEAKNCVSQKNLKCKIINTILAPIQRSIKDKGPGHVYDGLNWLLGKGVLMMRTNSINGWVWKSFLQSSTMSLALKIPLSL